jgi:hypothetical protein
MIFRKENIKLLEIGNSVAEDDQKYRRMIQFCITDLAEIFALTDWAGAVKN